MKSDYTNPLRTLSLIPWGADNIKLDPIKGLALYTKAVKNFQTVANESKADQKLLEKLGRNYATTVKPLNGITLGQRQTNSNNWLIIKNKWVSMSIWNEIII